jgi:hypothetical protein
MHRPKEPKRFPTSLMNAFKSVSEARRSTIFFLARFVSFLETFYEYFCTLIFSTFTTLFGYLINFPKASDGSKGAALLVFMGAEFF